ncbi:MAG: MaoC family dehydratase N-terminal domain-containing protein [Rhodospirillales bacterium]
MEADEARLKEWIGKSEMARDLIALERCRAMQATLDRTEPLLQLESPLPPLWHWLYFWVIAPRSKLGRDGHPALGGFLPPVGTARRMWAGSRVSFPQPLRIGEHAERHSTIKDVSVKTGRTGRLVFVTVRHQVAGASGVAVIDEHDIVYREDVGAGSSGRPGTPAPAEPSYAEEVKADATMLFRYSALTFNGHRIHYDRAYATQVEGYPGLVVHGPLLATLMVDLAARSWPHRRIANFEFRGLRPIIDTDAFTVCAAPKTRDILDVWIADCHGMLAMQGQTGFSAAA